MEIVLPPALHDFQHAIQRGSLSIYEGGDYEFKSAGIFSDTCP